MADEFTPRQPIDKYTEHYPDLFDPNAPGPTLDPIPTSVPTQIEQGVVEPSGVADVGGVTDQGFADPSLTEPDTPDQDLDHQPNA